MFGRRILVALLIVSLLGPVNIGFVPPAQARNGRVLGGLLGGLAAGLIVAGERRRERRERDERRERREERRAYWEARRQAELEAAARAAYAPPQYYYPPTRPAVVYQQGTYYPSQPVYEQPVVIRRYIQTQPVVQEVRQCDYYSED